MANSNILKQSKYGILISYSNGNSLTNHVRRKHYTQNLCKLPHLIIIHNNFHVKRQKPTIIINLLRNMENEWKKWQRCVQWRYTHAEQAD